MAKVNKDLFCDIALYIQKSQEKEVELITEYQELFNRVKQIMNTDFLFTVYDNVTGNNKPTPTAVADKKMLKLLLEQVQSIIGAELKHQKMMNMLYEAITGFKSEETK